MSKLLNATYADLIDVVTTSISHKFGIKKWQNRNIKNDIVYQKLKFYTKIPVAKWKKRSSKEIEQVFFIEILNLSPSAK